MRCGSGTVSIVPIGGIVLILGFLLDAAAFVTVFGAVAAYLLTAAAGSCVIGSLRCGVWQLTAKVRSIAFSLDSTQGY